MAITSTATSRHRQSSNISQPERVVSIVGGATLIGFGLQKKSWAGFGMAALGGALLYRGASGHCDIYQAFGVNTARSRGGRNVSVPYELGVRVDKTIIIAKPPEEVYQFWRNLENLPRFMGHLESVQEIDNKHSHWVAKAPAGYSVEWKAEIINEVENKLIGWRSLPGADVDNAGSVQFHPAGSGGTELKIALQYNPPGGVVGSWFAWLFGEEPSQQIDHDLGRLKLLLESGESTGPNQPRKKNPRLKGWDRDAVGQASEESFPASDPPSWTPEALSH